MTDHLYTQNLNGTRQLMENHLAPFSDGVRNALSAREELSLTKAVLADRVAVYAEARDSNKMAAVTVAGDMMLAVAKDVIHQIEKVTKIEQSQSEVITREQLVVFVRQIADLLMQRAELSNIEDDEAAFLVESIESMAGIGGGTSANLKEKELLELMAGTVPQVSVVES